MSFDVSALSNYTDEQRDQLILKQQLSGKTAQLVTVVPGVKGPTALNQLNTTVTFQTNSCGFNALDTTSLSNRVITPGDVKINEALCPKDLKSKWTVHKLKAGAKGDKESIPFEQEYSEAKAAAIAAAIEKALWQGDTGSGDANLSKWDGYKKIIDAASSIVHAGSTVGTGTVATTNTDATITGTGTSFTTDLAAGDKVAIAGTVYVVDSVTDDTHFEATVAAGATAAGLSYEYTKKSQLDLLGGNTVTAFTTSNANTIMRCIYNTIPTEVLDKDDMVIFIGMDWFRIWTDCLTNLNLFHYTAENSNFELEIPGTRVKVIAVNGLNGTNRAFAGQLSNFFYGVDLLEDAENFEIYYSKDNDQVRFKSEFKAGVQIGQPSEITEFRLSVA